MKILIAGATGAIGRPLVPMLQRDGQEVHGLARSPERAAVLQQAGVEPHVCDVYDAASVDAAVAAAAPDVLVHQLTAIPQFIDIRKYRAAFAETARLRGEATPHLMAAAQRHGVRRVLCQSVSFVTPPEGPLVHDEDEEFFVPDASSQTHDVMAATLAMERCVMATAGVEGIVLRYGFFYGPGTAYGPGGGNADEIAKRRFPIVGAGDGVASFVHIDDAADATARAVTGGTPGIYNVCDDEPAALHEWLPALAAAMGAKRPRRIPAFLARIAVGPHAVHFATTMRGNSNARFKQTFGWTPQHPSWQEGFAEVFRGRA